MRQPWMRPHASAHSASPPATRVPQDAGAADEAAPAAASAAGAPVAAGGASEPAADADGEARREGAAEAKDEDGEAREKEAAPAAGESGEQGGAGAPGAGAAAAPPAPTPPAAAQPPVRDGERVLVCLKRALKTAHAAQQQLAAALKGADTAPASLFVEILNHYLFYFGQGMPGITPSVLQARVSCGTARPPAARTGEPYERLDHCQAPLWSAPQPSAQLSGSTVARTAAPRRRRMRSAPRSARPRPAAARSAAARSPGAGARPAARRARRSQRAPGCQPPPVRQLLPWCHMLYAASCLQRSLLTQQDLLTAAAKD